MASEFPRLRPASPVILASSSPQRRELLSRIVDRFECVSPGIEEAAHAADPREFVKTLALQKAEAVAGRTSGEAIIIGADTIAWCEDEIIGKPADREDAVRSLLKLSHHPHCVLTGVCVRVCGAAAFGPVRRFLDAVETRIWMRPMSRREAEEYADYGNALDKAGAYALQEQADRFVQRIEGSFTNVIGLPLEWLSEVLLSIPGTLRVGPDAVELRLGD